MPIFRFNRGSLEGSLKTSVFVKNKKDLLEKIRTFNSLTGKPGTDDDGLWPIINIWNCDHLIIRPYCFDPRIGWDTHVVIAHNQCVSRDPYIVGFLSEDFQ